MIELNDKKDKFIIDGHELAYISILYEYNGKSSQIHKIGDSGQLSAIHKNTIKKYATSEEERLKERAKHFFVLELSPSDETLEVFKQCQHPRGLTKWHEENISKFAINKDW